jgi:hypothetical protein
VEEVVDVGEGGDGLHPPFERAQYQQLHPLDRLGFENVPCVPDLIDPTLVVMTRSQTKWAQRATIGDLITAGVRCNLSHLEV